MPSVEWFVNPPEEPKENSGLRLPPSSLIYFPVNVCVLDWVSGLDLISTSQLPVIHFVLGLFLVWFPVLGSFEQRCFHSEDYYRQYLCLCGLLSTSAGFSVGIIPHVNSQMTFNCVSALLCVSNKRNSEFCLWVQFPKLVTTSNSDEGKHAEVRFHRSASGSRDDHSCSLLDQHTFQNKKHPDPSNPESYISDGSLEMSCWSLTLRHTNIPNQKYI